MHTNEEIMKIAGFERTDVTADYDKLLEEYNNENEYDNFGDFLFYENNLFYDSFTKKFYTYDIDDRLDLIESVPYDDIEYSVIDEVLEYFAECDNDNNSNHHFKFNYVVDIAEKE